MPAESQALEPASREDEPEPGVLCPNCVCANAPSADFCQGCGAPLGLLATIDPLKCAFSEGIGYRQATSGPPKVIILVGMWLLFLPGLVALPFKLMSGSTSFGDLILDVFYFVLSGALVYSTTVNFVRKRRQLRLEPAEEANDQ